MKKELILKLLNLSNNYNIINIEEKEVKGRMGLIVDVEFNTKRIRGKVKCPVCGYSDVIIHERKKKKRLVLHLILPDGRRIYLKYPPLIYIQSKEK